MYYPREYLSCKNANLYYFGFCYFTIVREMAKSPYTQSKSDLIYLIDNVLSGVLYNGLFDILDHGLYGTLHDGIHQTIHYIIHQILYNTDKEASVLYKDLHVRWEWLTDGW